MKFQLALPVFYMATSKPSHMIDLTRTTATTTGTTSCYRHDDVLDVVVAKRLTSLLSLSLGLLQFSGSIGHVAYLKVSMFVCYPSNVN